VSQQASSIQDLVEVVRASISMMSKQWSNAMNLFHEKFSALPSLITAHGMIDICRSHNHKKSHTFILPWC
jgi:anaphase-promoting complex subunit 4